MAKACEAGKVRDRRTGQCVTLRGGDRIITTKKIPVEIEFRGITETDDIPEGMMGDVAESAMTERGIDVFLDEPVLGLEYATLKADEVERILSRSDVERMRKRMYRLMQKGR